MGAPMAGHLLAAGNDLTVWNRTPGRAEPLRAYRVKIAPSLEELGAECDAVMLCVNRTEDVEECLAGLTPSAAQGTLFVDHSTIAPDGARRIAADLRSRGFRFVDAPITGGSMGAQQGQLTIFMGGEEADVDEALAIVKPYTKRAERVGPSGAGQSAKMVNQIAVAGSLIAACEALSYASKSGLDVAQIHSLVSGGAGGSWTMDNYGPKILAQDWSPGFSVKNQRKDFGYCRAGAKSANAAIPCTELVDRLLARLEEQGHAEWATAALFEVLLEMGAD
jgi:3-hydroxyisobutyrate dehydrogenase-like beta-hydroxyacid dehydrogenase